MNEKLYETAENLEIKSKRLRDVIRSCEDEILFVENGADIALYARGSNAMYLSNCDLSQEDDAVLRNVIKMMLKARMERAEKELKEIFSVKELGGRV